MRRGDHLLSRCVKLALLVVVLTATPAFAHPARTAADGCHYCRTNCAQWGEVAGERHFMRKGNHPTCARTGSRPLHSNSEPRWNAQTAG